jgi:transcription elongation factor GreA
MNIQQINKWLNSGNTKEAENLWMGAIEDSPPPERVQETLAAFVKSGAAETAETLGWALLDAHSDAPKEQTLAYAKAALLGVPESEELRKQAISLYQGLHSEHENFTEIWTSAGLDGNQSPKRATRTLDTCLAIETGDYMGNRFDSRVIRIERMNALGEYEFTGDDEGSLEPKLLADEFDRLTASDFRVLKQKGPDALAELFRKKPGEILLGICQARGGEINVDDLKDFIIPKYLPAGKWTGWWGRARTAVKKSPHLTIEGRNPAIITFHAAGLSPEDELTPALAAARAPGEFLAVFREYASGVQKRKETLNVAFAQKISDALARLTIQFAPRVAANAFEAALMLDAALALGAPKPAKDAPTPSALLAGVKEPAVCIAHLRDASLWSAALNALEMRDDATEKLETLLLVAPVSRLDEVVDRLAKLESDDAIGRAIERAMYDSLAHLDLCAWLWVGPKHPLPNAPDGLTLLTKLLDSLHDIDHKWDADRYAKRNARQLVRNTLQSKGCKRFGEVLDTLNEHMAAVIKGKIERTDGLATTASEGLMDQIRQRFYSLFLKKKISPWLDETVIWTSNGGMEKRKEEMRVLQEVTMPINAKQIGEAASFGDLRENADWAAAIEERDRLFNLARKLNDELTLARILEARDVLDDVASVGSKVTLTPTAGGESVDLLFLGPWDVNAEEKIYSYKSRIGQSLMGKRLGATITIDCGYGEQDYDVTALTTGVE